jgi:hypothetical protein
MENICIKVDIPKEFEKEFKSALSKVVKELVNKLELAVAEDIVSESKFTERDADELSKRINLSMSE